MSKLSIFISFLVPIVFLISTQADLIIQFHTDDIIDMKDVKDVQVSINMTDAEEECNRTYTVDREYLLSLFESGSFPEETNKMPKCYVKCLLENLQIIDDYGDFDAQNVTQYLNMFKGDNNETVIINIVNKCVEDNDEMDKCEKAYGFARCILEDMIELFDD